jgi:hypothetical protein
MLIVTLYGVSIWAKNHYYKNALKFRRDNLKLYLPLELEK